jgi:hypothetical protein
VGVPQPNDHAHLGLLRATRLGNMQQSEHEEFFVEGAEISTFQFGVKSVQQMLFVKCLVSFFVNCVVPKHCFLYKNMRLPGVGSDPGSSRFHLFSHFSPLSR